MANNNTMNENMQFEDMGTNTPASEIARRGQQLKQQESSFKEEAGQFFEQEEMSLKQQSAMNEMKKQTAQMKDVMKQKQLNFDQALADAHTLESMQAGAKQQMVDAKIKFMRDAQGRKMLSESQLQDYMMTKAKSEEDWKNYAARSEQLHQRKIQLLQAAYKRLEMEEKQLYSKEATKVNQDTKRYITQMKVEADKKVAKAKQKAANNSAIVSGLATAGTAAGAIVGTAFGGIGAPVGAAAGGLIGTAIGGAIVNNQ